MRRVGQVLIVLAFAALVLLGGHLWLVRDCKAQGGKYLTGIGCVASGSVDGIAR